MGTNELDCADRIADFMSWPVIFILLPMVIAGIGLGKSLRAGRPIGRNTLVGVAIVIAGLIILLWGSDYSEDIYASLAFLCGLVAYGAFVEHEDQHRMDKASLPGKDG